ncbi:acyl-CoA dehydrogenase family protein [Blastococcus sp. TF02A-26]|uniref:acyl-CoA dehydrogenase family protein n=1 Tax=Blastococcus sp. TF02A-26 TaxID=2250577 RepID=UPI000DEBD50E|nr:acyl-CoA dehydrogenase family protein [Blastococcus sp. TF02A-26]RBY83177.1 acyl-CoA dehydrogenase [Blastococcus sp. TF02A-26]
MERFELRRQDFSLDEDQQAVREGFGDFFTKQVPSSLVRDAEPLGFDADLWQRVVAMGATSMALPEAVGGDDATLVDLVLVAEELGKVVAPVPLVSHVVASRLLASAGGADELVAAAAGGERIVTLALQPVVGGNRQLVPDAALARDVVAWSAEGLTLHTVAEPAAHVPNQGSTPLAWFDPAAGERTVLATGPEAEALFRTAVGEWKLLTAAALVGIGQSALDLGVEFAKTRRTLGVAIGALQGVAFPLADVVTELSGARNLVLKAAWYATHEPRTRPDLPLAAFVHAARAATEAAWVSAHTQGGLGFTIEADISLFFLRAKGWSVLGGDPGADRRAVATALLASV